MPKFSYHAKDLQGNDRTGTVETVDQRQVARAISKRGLIVIEIKEIKDRKGGLFYKFLNRVSFGDLVIATRQLATMIESGLVLSEALDILRDQQKGLYFKEVLDEVGQDVKSGLELSAAFKKFPDVFPDLFCNLVKAGESSGKLDTVLAQMATNLEKTREFRSKVRGALIYPVIIVVAMFIVMTIMVLFVIPKLTALYTQSNIELPLPTKILIAISSFATNFWWVVLTVIVVGVIFFQRWIKTQSGHFQFDAFLLKIPVVKKIIEGMSLAEFTRTFGLLTTAGIPILESLQIVSQVIDNMVYRKALTESLKGVERGLPLSKELESFGVFPSIIPAMYRVGEETGKVDQVSFKLAEYFEQEADQLVKNLTVILEPLVLVLLGVGVAFLVLSIILPIYKLTTSFS
ncbi:hypothetical protein A2631_03620 [Candidatus Daviesbacteria bacterium RIFCSPHIGHO2_01_FULL_44_29]|nr:MAG: hypothetical protein A2631_03620 [Candidatus Daviesbacteria bacterium RIFCSPHIGHO2_01_FULL_44_29]OGE38812.1 MAG: hypothetical protein A3E86_02765 [Candidatus Daviesbacteria bacterium RIFCSPHIGHO2_12_FULL_47_45]OGE70000.1 MAG: hypothetical protein A3B55_04885 [Candidatus Daviesbacteria bacterium RIFCSPLOWO2_01_FULL_43_15]